MSMASFISEQFPSRSSHAGPSEAVRTVKAHAPQIAFIFNRVASRREHLIANGLPRKFYQFSTYRSMSLNSGRLC
jgi:hypothetical protein